jgi:hypothetical protein
VHDGEFRIGQLDGETGRMLISSPELRIEHNREAGYVSFNPPAVYLPERPIVQIGARSYHTPSEDMQPQPTFCDFAGLYDFVDVDTD